MSNPVFKSINQRDVPEGFSKSEWLKNIYEAIYFQREIAE